MSALSEPAEPAATSDLPFPNPKTQPHNPENPLARQPIKISVATVCYNAGNLIERTFHSVEEQDYPAVEHLIVDGNSTDHTLEHVHHYMERNSIASVKHEINCLSEPDGGIYDAMNKALQLCTGRYIVFLNAGDKFHSADTLSRIAALIEGAAQQPAAVYGDTHLVDEDGHFLRRRRLEPPEELDWHDFRRGMLVCHQSIYVRTDIAYKQPYDLRYRFSADFDWVVRILREAGRRNLPVLNSHLVLTDYLNEGATTRNHRRSLFERLRIMARHYGWPATLAEHLWFVVRAFIKK